MKKIEDYLHLYLGSDIEVKKPNGNVTFQLVGISFDSFNKVGNLEKAALAKGKDGIIWPLKLNWFKLILRPLSDMTEEESEEAGSLYYDFMEKQKPGSKDITMMAHMTKWFLSKGFDLFGLHEAGLCIYKKDGE